jgi:hypothetical protein
MSQDTQVVEKESWISALLAPSFAGLLFLWYIIYETS